MNRYEQNTDSNYGSRRRGGIPVYTKDNGELESFDAVVDKDLASAIVAHEIGARDFFILTDVRTVFLNFGQKTKRLFTA